MLRGLGGKPPGPRQFWHGCLRVALSELHDEVRMLGAQIAAARRVMLVETALPGSEDVWCEWHLDVDLNRMFASITPIPSNET